MANKKALMVWGGWNGHTPKESVDVFAPLLQAKGYDVQISDSMDLYKDADLMASLDLIVPVWTMGQIEPEQEKGLLTAVQNGCGLAGFHGGLIDAFRNNVTYQWMTGANWVSHPGGCIPEYKVKITNKDHEITRGIDDFILPNTEQYYLHTDPGNSVLATTTFSGEHDPSHYPAGVVMPYAWTRKWGNGTVFAAAWGHTFKDFDVPEAKEIVLRGMQFVTRK